MHSSAAPTPHEPREGSLDDILAFITTLPPCSPVSLSCSANSARPVDEVTLLAQTKHLVHE